MIDDERRSRVHSLLSTDDKEVTPELFQ
jgi:hypothetical protein